MSPDCWLCITASLHDGLVLCMAEPYDSMQIWCSSKHLLLTIGHDDELAAGSCMPVQVICGISFTEDQLMNISTLGKRSNPVLDVQRNMQFLCNAHAHLACTASAELCKLATIGTQQVKVMLAEACQIQCALTAA